MVTNNDILKFFESFAPANTAMDFDNVGLLLGEEYREIRRALVSLDITCEVVCEAEALGCELIISHHPVIFNPLKKLRPHDVPYMLSERNIDALCMHTNLDLSDSFGVNTCLAQAIGLANIRKSEKGECLFTGELEKALDINTFAQNVKEALNCNGLRYTDVKRAIKKVAVSSGSGGCEIYAAVNEGADVLVTGEIKHHEILEANAAGMSIIDVGHFKSEDIVISPLIKKLSDNFPEVLFTKSKAFTDGIKFL